MSRSNHLVAPFPWFGGKSLAARDVWYALGKTYAYIEPFAGSAAVLLNRPWGPAPLETINDLDGFVVNFWRSLRYKPDELLEAIRWPLFEADLLARHLHLVENRETLKGRLVADPDFCDPKLAGWWAWGLSAWVGSGWCSGEGGWRLVNGELVAGHGVKKGGGFQVSRLQGRGASGVSQKQPRTKFRGQGAVPDDELVRWIGRLADRMGGVRVLCGDWSRALGVSTFNEAKSKGRLTGVFFDPPYPEGFAPDKTYTDQDKPAVEVCRSVFREAMRLGEDPGIRVVVAGYAGTWNPPRGWTERRWKARRGYAAGDNDNRSREVLWCSPACVPARASVVRRSVD